MFKSQLLGACVCDVIWNRVFTDIVRLIKASHWGWGNGSVGKGFALQAWGPELDPQHPFDLWVHMLINTALGASDKWPNWWSPDPGQWETLHQRKLMIFLRMTPKAVPWLPQAPAHIHACTYTHTCLYTYTQGHTNTHIKWWGLTALRTGLNLVSGVPIKGSVEMKLQIGDPEKWPGERGGRNWGERQSHAGSYYLKLGGAASLNT